MIERQTTKDILAASLIEISHDLSIDKISVQDICDNCDVGRTTFYYHFQDKFDLISWIYEKSIRLILNAFSCSGNSVKLLEGYIERYEHFSEFYVNAIRNTKDDDYFIRTMYEITTKVIDERIEFTGQKINAGLRFSVSFDIRMAIWAIIDWSLSGKPCSIHELAELIDGSFTKDVKDLLCDF